MSFLVGTSHVEKIDVGILWCQVETERQRIGKATLEPHEIAQ